MLKQEKPKSKRRKELPREDMEEVRKPRTDPKRELPRIWVEWICGECNRVHRISFGYSFKPVWIKRREDFRVTWGRAKLIKVELGRETTLSEMNEFLNSLFSQKFNAKEYVKIYYPKKLLDLLTEDKEYRKKLLALLKKCEGERAELLSKLKENEKEHKELLFKLTDSCKH